MVGPTPEPTRSDGSESVTCLEEPGAAKAGAGSPRGQPSGRPGRSALGVPGVPSFKPAAGPTPRPGVSAPLDWPPGKGCARSPKSQRDGRLPVRAPPPRGRTRGPAAPAPARGAALTERGHRAGLEEQAVPAAARLQQDAALRPGLQPPEQPQPLA